MAPLFSPGRCDTKCAQPFDNGIDYQLSLQIDAHRVTLGGTTLDVNLSLSDNSKPHGSSSSIIGRLCSAVDLSLITKLQYHDKHTGHSTLAVCAWNTLLASMPSLTAIELDAPKQLNSMQSIIVALTPDSEDPPITFHLCPQLKHLHLNLSGQQRANASTIFTYCLLRCLRIRRFSGYAHLDISVVLLYADGSLDNTGIEKLKILAGDVHVHVRTLTRHQIPAHKLTFLVS
jgi:hypothetical protein